MKQHFSSAATSINKDRLPAIYSRLDEIIADYEQRASRIFLGRTGPQILDYGCGKYTDHLHRRAHESYATLYPYDPYNQPQSENGMTRYCLEGEPAKIAICSNVLNVIDSDDAIKDLLHDIASMTNGILYITVFEGTGKGIGKQTGKDQYQRNMKTRDYVPLIAAAGYECQLKKGIIRVNMQR